MSGLSRDDRVRLRTLLLAEFAWLSRTDIGPQSVDAGECADCGQRPNLLPTCGPGAGVAALCAGCALSRGIDAWCDGHQGDAEEALAWAAALPTDWPEITRLWWVATGEVRLDPSLVSSSRHVAELVSRVKQARRG